MKRKEGEKDSTSEWVSPVHPIAATIGPAHPLERDGRVGVVFK